MKIEVIHEAGASRRTAGRSSAYKPGTVRISSTKAKGADSGQCCFRIDRELMKSMRWVTGDRVQIAAVFAGEDANLALLICRKPTGLKLSAGSKNNEQAVTASCKIRDEQLKAILEPSIGKEFVPQQTEHGLVVFLETER